MPLTILPVTHDVEFNEIVQCECESYRTPFNPFFRLFRHDESRAGFIELRDRQIREFREDETARWFKVVDTEIGDKVVGAAKWNVFLENPYVVKDGERRGEHREEAGWWPDGEEREFANKLLDGLLRPRWQKMARPHLLLAMLFVHPEHRRRGAARQLIDWGVREADRLGLETFIEATDDGKPTYEACGFTFMGTQYWETARRNPSKRWSELERFVKTPIHVYLMWRPKGGKFVEGETIIPWEA